MPSFVADRLLEEFSAFWQKRVNAGESSSMDRLEWMAIEIFVEWLESKRGQKALQAASKEAPNA